MFNLISFRISTWTSISKNLPSYWSKEPRLSRINPVKHKSPIVWMEKRRQFHQHFSYESIMRSFSMVLTFRFFFGKRNLVKKTARTLLVKLTKEGPQKAIFMIKWSFFSLQWLYFIARVEKNVSGVACAPAFFAFVFVYPLVVHIYLLFPSPGFKPTSKEGLCNPFWQNELTNGWSYVKNGGPGM